MTRALALPGFGLICQFLDNGRQDKRMENNTANHDEKIRANPNNILFLTFKPSCPVSVALHSCDSRHRHRLQ